MIRKILNIASILALKSAVITFVGCFVIIGCNIIGPFFENKYFPVLSDMDIVQINRTGDVVEFLVSGRKNRPCSFKSIAALSEIDGHYERSTVTFGTVNPNGSPGRPTGQQSFGHWFTKPTGDKIKFISIYDCHPLWDTVSDLGEVELM